MPETSKKRKEETPNKQEYEVAKFLRFTLPTKKAKFHDMDVNCFFASAAVDALLDSQWSASKASEPLFTDRDSCIDFCHKLMEKGVFHRAVKVKRKKEKDSGDQSKKKKAKEAEEKEEGGTGDEVRERKKTDKTEVVGEAEPEKTTAGESEEVKEEKKTKPKKKEKTGEEKKNKKEKPLKLAMTNDQRFLDGKENIYVWIYDPPSAKTLVIGSLIVFGCIAVCLLPLWPSEVHSVVYSCSVAGLVVVGTILGLAIIRFIVFCAIWLLTLGRLHFWLLPNLTEDVGFFQSFRPLYKYQVVPKQSSASGEEKEASKLESRKKSEGKARSSDGEDSDGEQEFEMVGRGDVEDDKEGEEGEEEQEEEGEENEEAEEEEEEEEEGEDDGVEDEEDEEMEEECEEEEKEEEAELKKNK